MEGRDVQLLAYDVLEAAMVAADVEAAARAAREELEVRSREDLLRVAVAVTVEAVRILTPVVDRPRLLDRLRRRRLHVMVGPL